MKLREKKTLSETESALAAYPLSVCAIVVFSRFPFPLSSALLRERERRRESESPLSETAELVQPSHLTGPKTHSAAVSANQRGVLGRDYLE